MSLGTNFSFVFAGILDVINDFSKTYGGPGKFWLGNRLFVYIDDPKHFEIILNAPTSLNKGDSYDFIIESIGYGLITLKCNLNQFKIIINNFRIVSFYVIFLIIISSR